MIKDLYYLLFPPACALCGNGLAAGEQHICSGCIFQLPKFRGQRETRSYLPGLIGGHNYAYVFSYIKYFKAGIGHRLVQEIKYGGKPELAFLIGLQLGKIIESAPICLDIIIPVPLHKKKRRKRGYNQSDYIAEGISKGTGIAWNPELIVRIRNNPTQTNKSRMDRIDNVEGIFQVEQSGLLNGRNVILVDDVITTGATLNACAQALHSAGASVKGIASIAMARM